MEGQFISTDGNKLNSGIGVRLQKIIAPTIYSNKQNNLSQNKPIYSKNTYLPKLKMGNSKSTERPSKRQNILQH